MESDSVASWNPGRQPGDSGGIGPPGAGLEEHGGNAPSGSGRPLTGRGAGSYRPALFVGGNVKSPFLIGDRIYLRPLEPEDAAVCAAWFNDQEVTRFLLRYRPLTLAEEREFLLKLASDPTVLSVGIALRSDDRLIGSTGLHHLDLRNRCSSFGIVIGEASEWSKGYGSEATALVLRHAFDTMNLHRVWLQVHAFNDRAIQCYERLGFRREGSLRDEVYRDGRYWDTLVMGILENEWRALRPREPRTK